jgi:MFS family permease
VQPKVLHRNFLAWLGTRFFLIFSSYALNTVLSYFLYQKTKSTLDLGLIGLAELIPAIGFALFAGHFVDKSRKRKVLIGIVCSCFLLASSLAIISNTYFAHCSAVTFKWFVLSAIFLLGTIRAFVSPTSFSVLAIITNPALMTKTISINTSAWYMGAIIGPLVAGVLISIYSLPQILWIIAATFLCAALFAINIKGINTKSEQTSAENIWQSLGAGLKFVFSNKVLLAALCLDMFAVLFGGAESMLPAFNAQVLQADSITFGWLRCAHGLGSILLTIILAFAPLKKSAGKKLLACIAGFGFCMIAFALSKSFVLAFSVLFIGGMFDNISVLVRSSILQSTTPADLRGRVASVNSIFISSSNELGALESGIAASIFGLFPSIITGGCITVLIAIITWFAAKPLKLYETPKQA